MDHLNWIIAFCGFTREHHTVRAIQHCIGNIAGLGSGRPRVERHGLQHLCCTDHRLAFAEIEMLKKEKKKKGYEKVAIEEEDEEEEDEE